MKRQVERELKIGQLASFDLSSFKEILEILYRRYKSREPFLYNDGQNLTGEYGFRKVKSLKFVLGGGGYNMITI